MKVEKMSQELIKSIESLYLEGKTVRQIAKELKTGTDGIMKYLRSTDLIQGSKRHTPDILEEEKTVIDLYKSGMSIYRISKEINLPKDRVHKIVQDIGLSQGNRRSINEELGAKILIAYENLFSPTIIAKILGLTPHTIRNYLTKVGVYKKKKTCINLDIQQLSCILGSSVESVRHYYKPLKRAIGDRKYENHPNWQGGRTLDEKGYVFVKIKPDDPYYPMCKGGGYISEHRYIMAKHLGRLLSKKEEIHHIDGNRQNNDISNLQLRLGAHGSGVVCRCVDCGSLNITYDEIES